MYSSVTDVRNAVAPGPISRTDPATAGSLNETQIIDAITEADGIVDLHVGNRYVVTQDPVDTTVAIRPFRYWSRNIAAYLATLSQRRSKPVDENDPVRLRYVETMGLLLQVRDGTLDIPGATAVDTADAGDEVFVYNQYDGKLFGMADFGLRYSPNGETPLWPGH